MHQNPIHRTHDSAHDILSWDLMCGTHSCKLRCLDLSSIQASPLWARLPAGGVAGNKSGKRVGATHTQLEGSLQCARVSSSILSVTGQTPPACQWLPSSSLSQPSKQTLQTDKQTTRKKQSDKQTLISDRADASCMSMASYPSLSRPTKQTILISPQ